MSVKGRSTAVHNWEAAAPAGCGTTVVVAVAKAAAAAAVPVCKHQDGNRRHLCEIIDQRTLKDIHTIATGTCLGNEGSSVIHLGHLQLSVGSGLSRWNESHRGANQQGNNGGSSKHDVVV